MHLFLHYCVQHHNSSQFFCLIEALLLVLCNINIKLSVINKPLLKHEDVFQQVTDTDIFIRSAIQSMQFTCEETFMKNMSYWEPNPDNNGTLKPPSNLQKELCPGLCSDNGVCVNSTCKCNDPYIGDDCSINKRIPPKIDSVGFEGLCDIRNHSKCHLIKIRGSGFLENENLTCRTIKLKVICVYLQFFIAYFLNFECL